jgi:hypothetical protein
MLAVHGTAYIRIWTSFAMKQCVVDPDTVGFHYEEVLIQFDPS